MSTAIQPETITVQLTPDDLEHICLFLCGELHPLLLQVPCDLNESLENWPQLVAEYRKQRDPDDCNVEAYDLSAAILERLAPMLPRKEAAHV